MTEEEITLQKLKEIFLGKNIKITNPGNPKIRDDQGICKNIHLNNLGFDFELNDNSRYSLVPDILTDTYVEGEIGIVRGRRKIELI